MGHADALLENFVQRAVSWMEAWRARSCSRVVASSIWVVSKLSETFRNEDLANEPRYGSSSSLLFPLDDVREGSALGLASISLDCSLCLIVKGGG
jgi:hypothetical protein